MLADPWPQIWGYRRTSRGKEQHRKVFLFGMFDQTTLDASWRVSSVAVFGSCFLAYFRAVFSIIVNCGSSSRKACAVDAGGPP